MRDRSYVLFAAVVCAVAVSPAPGAESSQTFYVFSGRDQSVTHYIPSGYMGDTDNLTVSAAMIPSHGGGGTPLRIVYTPTGQKGWAGIYWQHPANNWGDRPGKTGFDLTGASRLMFWARGEKGGEKIHEVHVGGILGRFPDSDVAKTGPIKLTADWKQYSIDLTGKDLRHIIGGFEFSMNKTDNAGPVTFYVDDIAFDMPQGGMLPMAKSGLVIESTPAMGVADSTPVPAALPGAVAPAPPAPPVVSTETAPAADAMKAPESPSKDIAIKAEDKGLRVSFSSQFLFAAGKATLRPESARILGEVIEVLKAYPDNDVLIEGHTDATGSAAANLTLSTTRAENVRDYLISEGGLGLKRFRVVGYGQTQPVADNDSPSGRAQNRRVEVIILKGGENK